MDTKVQPLRGSSLWSIPLPNLLLAGTLRLPREGEGWVNRPWKPFGLLSSLLLKGSEIDI